MKIELDETNSLKIIKIAQDLNLSYTQVVNLVLKSIQAADMYLDVFGEVHRQENPNMRKIRVRRHIKLISRI